MEWSEECRIKHLSTGQYLAVTSPDYKVCCMNAKLPTASTSPLYMHDSPCIGDTEELYGFICLNNF